MAVSLFSDNALLTQTVFGFVPTTYVGLFSDIATIHQIANGGDISYYPEYTETDEGTYNFIPVTCGGVVTSSPVSNQRMDITFTLSNPNDFVIPFGLILDFGELGTKTIIGGLVANATNVEILTSVVLTGIVGSYTFSWAGSCNGSKTVNLVSPLPITCSNVITSTALTNESMDFSLDLSNPNNFSVPYNILVDFGTLGTQTLSGNLDANAINISASTSIVLTGIVGSYTINWSDSCTGSTTIDVAQTTLDITCANATTTTPITDQSMDFSLDLSNPNNFSVPYNVLVDFGTLGTQTMSGNLAANANNVTVTKSVTLTNIVGSYTIGWSGDCTGNINVNVADSFTLSINITDYTTQTTGVTLDFAGNVYGKYLDQSDFTFASATENLRTYSSNGLYSLIIYGDIGTITHIDITDSNVTGNVDLRKTGLVGTQFGLSQNKFTTLNIENLAITQINQETGFVKGLSSNIQKIYAKNTQLIELWNDASEWTNLNYLDLTNVTTLTKLQIAATNLSSVIGFSTLINLSKLNVGILAGSWVSKTLDISNFDNLKEFYAISSDFSNGIVGLNQTTKLEIINLADSNIGGTLDLSLNPNVAGISSFLDGNDFTTIILDNTKVTSVNTAFFGSLQGSDNLTTLHVRNDNYLNEINVINKTLLTDVNLTGSSFLAVDLSGCALSQTSVNNAINVAITNGQSNGTLHLSGGTNSAPSTGESTNIATLQSNGWSVLTN